VLAIFAMNENRANLDIRLGIGEGLVGKK